MNRLRVLILSDGTGETAKSSMRAALTQFPDLDLVLTPYKNLHSCEQIEDILKEAMVHHDAIAYTIVAPKLRDYLKKRLIEESLPSVDLIGPLIGMISEKFNQKPNQTAGLKHRVDDKYFSRISALEFTLDQDSSQSPKNLELADIVILGVSRTSKTPLAVYLAMQGYKVVNLTISSQKPVPPEIFKIDQGKIFALTITTEKLIHIRKNRLTEEEGKNLDKSYADDKSVEAEVKWSLDLYQKNIRWPLIDVTDKALEDAASEIVKMIEMRNHNQFKHNKRMNS